MPTCWRSWLWLGVTLGSMAILMLRHLTGGGWGMVIRRMLEAAMRCMPLMTVFFVPVAVRHPRGSTSGPGRWSKSRQGICASICRRSPRAYLIVHGFILRAAIYFAIWNLLSFFLTKWSAEQDHPRRRDNTARFKALSGPGLILYALHHLVRGDRLGDVARSPLDLDHLRSADPDRRKCLSALCFAVVVERILFRYKPMSELLKPEYVHDHGKFMLDLHHGVGLLRLFAVADHLGGQPAGRNHLVHARG